MQKNEEKMRKMFNIKHAKNNCLHTCTHLLQAHLQKTMHGMKTIEARHPHKSHKLAAANTLNARR